VTEQSSTRMVTCRSAPPAERQTRTHPPTPPRPAQKHTHTRKHHTHRHTHARTRKETHEHTGAHTRGHTHARAQAEHTYNHARIEGTTMTILALLTTRTQRLRRWQHSPALALALALAHNPHAHTHTRTRTHARAPGSTRCICWANHWFAALLAPKNFQPLRLLPSVGLSSPQAPFAIDASVTSFEVVNLDEVSTQATSVGTQTRAHAWHTHEHTSPGPRAHK
jgi:hypothetical protein